MSLTIWKYTVPVQEEVIAHMPAGAEVLTVQTQDGVPVVWARVNGAAKLVPRTLRWRGTGHAANNVGAYVGTIKAGPLVFHLFIDISSNVPGVVMTARASRRSDYAAARVALGMSPPAADRLSRQIAAIGASLARGQASARRAVAMCNRATRAAIGGAQ